MNTEELALNLYKIYLDIDITDQRVCFYDDRIRDNWIRIAKTIQENYLEFFVYGGT